MALKSRNQLTSSKHMIIARFISIFMVISLLLTSFTACKSEDGNTLTNEKLTDKEMEDVNNNSNQTNELSVAPTQYDKLVDGVGGISYIEGGVKYFGIINTNGEIIYSTDKSVTFTAIGKGATVVHSNSGVPTDIIDNNGKVVATFELEDEMQLLAYGDGLALIYFVKDNISTVEHLYGVIDFSGKWVYSLTNLGCSPFSSWEYNHYAGDGVFAIMTGRWGAGSGGDDFIFLNSNTGDTFFVSRLDTELFQFANGVTFASSNTGSFGAIYSDLVNPYPKTNESEEIELPKYFLLYSDGTYKEYDMEGKNFGGYSNGYLWYTIPDDKTNVYIEDITSSTNNIFTYSEYPTSAVRSISFNGDYGLVTLRSNGLYFTLIDKNGNQQFDPIETTSYNSVSGNHWVVFSNDTIVYSNADKKYCIANKNGEVMVTDYYTIGAFANGVATALIYDGKWGSEQVWLYINTNGEQVLKTGKKS